MTTPLGVPNLPPGALTLPTLGSLQDQSATALRGAASAWMPGIFNASTGGNILSDLSPFGIVTRIWAEVVAAIAAADPGDIDGPEDLPGLLNDFIEGLPVVGQLIGLLQAILGLYDGDDAVLLAVQQIFMPIRKLLQLVSGQPVGFPTVEEITEGWVNLGPAIAENAGKLASFLAATGEATFTAAGAQLRQLILFLASWLDALARLGANNPIDLVNSLKGLAAPAQRDIDGKLSMIGEGVANFVDNLNGTWSFVTQQGEADIANLVQGADGAVYTAAQIAQQTVAAANAAGVGVGQAISAGQQMVDHGIAAIAGGLVQAGQSAQAYAAAVTGSYTNWFNAWTGGSATSAAAAEIAAAAAAAAEAARQQVLATNAINALTPHLYGGRGTSGLPIQSVTFAGSALPDEFDIAASIATNSAVYNEATASTDQETVSAFWNTSLASTAPAGGMGPARYLFLRANATLTTYLYLKYWCDNTTPYSTVRIELGCVVLGIKFPLKTDSVTVYPVTIYGHIDVTLINFHPDYQKWTGLLNSPQGWTLQATGSAISVSGPGSYAVTVYDGDPGDDPTVSQMDASHRCAGVGSDEAAWLTNLTDWNFYDSGPTAGPAIGNVDDAETATSTTYADLPNVTGDVTFNIGPSLLAIVAMDCQIIGASVGMECFMGLEFSGANTAAATDSFACFTRVASSSGQSVCISRTVRFDNEGPTTATPKFKVSTSSAIFRYRNLSVTPL